MKKSKKALELRKLFKIFEDNQIFYIVLKNYDDFENSNDIDILIKSNPKLKDILKKQGYSFKKIKSDFGAVKGNIVLHIRINGINYGGAILRNTWGIFNSRVRYKSFYILKKEDLYIHLILHAILNKKRFKESYIQEIEKITPKVNKKEIKRKLKQDFGFLGIKLLSLVERKEYERALKLRKQLLFKIFTLKNFLNYLLKGTFRRLRI